ncbi:MAG: hypothetical protein MUC68_11680 [Burkholderiaceae bacterium]|jgi:hypothetical protein|nr:hypothetical protein [Burkholderiaceae bacterium]
MRRNLLAPAFWIAPDARERARDGARLLADAVQAQVSPQPRLVGNSAEEVLKMAQALHTAGLMSDAEIDALRRSAVREPLTSDGSGRP